METSSSLNYDRIATEYNQRYPSSQHWERGQALLDLARQVRAQTVLEVGSGTGFWLNLLHTIVPDVFGLDYSLGMIREAQRQPAPLKLLRGSAIQLPYRDQSFDFVCCVDAIHHFVDHRHFISEAFRVLKPGGALAVIGHDPHEGTSKWYIYDYFNGVLDTDLRRYPSGRSVVHCMDIEGFVTASTKTIEHILNVHVGEAVLRDPFLKKSATSQLALLSDGDYASGIRRLEQAIAGASTRQEKIIFSSDIYVQMFLGYKP
jgi:ubiquinone/menaquinone biosynthesis C-methylase UbiE